MHPLVNNCNPLAAAATAARVIMVHPCGCIKTHTLPSCDVWEFVFNLIDGVECWVVRDDFQIFIFAFEGALDNALNHHWVGGRA